MTVQIQRSGSIYKARFEGTADFTFGETPNQARRSLLLWKKDYRPTKLLLSAKFQNEVRHENS
jgi:hypothetical protein